MGLFRRRRNPYTPPFDGIPHFTDPPADVEAWLDEVFDGRSTVALTYSLRFARKVGLTKIATGAAQRGYRMDGDAGVSPIATFVRQ